jgi:hypothetical protein
VSVKDSTAEGNIHARARANSVTSSPARRRGLAALARVAPVVVTSSMRMTRVPGESDVSARANAPATFERRSVRESRVCCTVARVRARRCGRASVRRSSGSESRIRVI